MISRKVERDLSQQDGKYLKPSFYIVFAVYHCCRSLYSDFVVYSASMSSSCVGSVVLLR